MAKNNVADLLSVGSLFTTQAERDEAQRETVRDISLEEISDFPNHPFKVRVDASMMEASLRGGVASPPYIWRDKDVIIQKSKKP